MDVRKSQLRRWRKASRTVKRKSVALWKTLGIFSLVLAILFTVCGSTFLIFDNVVAALLGIAPWRVIDPDAEYTKKQFVSDAELKKNVAQINNLLVEEGSVLLINNGALPLKEASAVCVLSDTENEGELLNAALRGSGLTVSPEAMQWDAVVVCVSAWEALEQKENPLLTATQWKSEGKVGTVILLLCTPNVARMELISNEAYSVDACLWVADGAQYGADAIGGILVGRINPSGSLPETASYGLTTAPSGGNILPVTYSGTEETHDSYLIYQEGIYVGYSYYETRYEDVVMATGNPGDYTYRDAVAFPFGYGLGYTSFAFGDLAVTYSEETDRYSVSVTVTNTGGVAGKETVQIYAQSPYTQYDMDNRVEKASVRLVGFGKTALLEPSANETVVVEVDRSALASFDTYGTGTYILDAGDYYLTAATDAHAAINNILAAKGYTGENTEGRMDAVGNGAMTYRFTQAAFDGETYAVGFDGNGIQNRLSQADPNLREGADRQEVRWLSRSDWEGTYPKEKQALAVVTAEQDSSRELAEMPTMRAKNGIKLQEMAGIPYDDPKWEQLLDQLSYGEMVSLVADGFLWQMPVWSIHAPGVREESELLERLQAWIGVDSEPKVFPSGKLAAAVYNTELLYRLGNMIGDSSLANETPYAQLINANVQRISGGDGVSEDAFLTGMTCAAQINGAKEKGVVLAVDCSALDESGKAEADVWLNEQTAREVYLRPLKLSGADSITGDTLCAGLLTGILKDEWGWQGVFTISADTASKGNAGEGVVAGVTSYDGVFPDVALELWFCRWNPVVVSAMREACHRNLYVTVNSAAMNRFGPETEIRTYGYIYPAVIGVVVLLWVLFAVFLRLWIKGIRKWKQSEPYLRFQTIKRALKEEKR